MLPYNDRRQAYRLISRLLQIVLVRNLSDNKVSKEEEEERTTPPSPNRIETIDSVTNVYRKSLAEASTPGARLEKPKHLISAEDYRVAWEGAQRS